MKKLFFFVFTLALGMVAGALLYRQLLGRGAGAPAAGQGRQARKILYYVDPMHPAYKSDKPGIAPDCGMNLEPVYEDGGAAAGAETVAMPPGTINVSPEKQQLIGVKFSEVRAVPLSRTIRAVGKVTWDETKIARIHAKFAGWIDTLTVDYTGQLVKQGQPLLSIYSPELLASQQELLLAQKARGYLAGSPVKEAAAGAESLYAAARRRLELWDITDDQIQEILRRNAPIKTMTVFSPISGYVLTKNVFPKQRITPDTELYTIADLSTVWVIADIYEYEAAAVRLGQPVRMTLAYDPGRAFRGTVTYLYPQVDNTTRTLKARIEFPNPSLQLKPDMYANVEFVVDYGRKLAVPEEAVLDSGAETRVFVDRGQGYLEARRVELGEKAGGWYIVLSGLKPGERVVTSGNFLVDSESQLKSAAAGMGVGAPGSAGVPPATGQPGQTGAHKPEGHGGHRP